MSRPGFLQLDLGDPSLTLLLDGVVADNGSLRLAPVPSGPSGLGPEISVGVAFDGPAGIAVDSAGDVFVADPNGNRILHIGACESEGAPLPCVTGPGSEPGLVDAPRGVAAGPRNRLYVGDTGNDRIQAFDLATFQLVGLAAGIDEPWDLAVDSTGALYVVEHGAKRVSKLDVELARVPGFAAAIDGQAVVPGNPASVAVAIVDGEEILVVVDDDQLLVYALDGIYDAARTAAWNAALTGALGGAVSLGGVAASPSSFYVGEDAGGGVLAFSLDGTFLGRVPGYSSGAAGLAFDDRGRLLVHPGAGRPVQLGAAGVVPAGSFLIGPVSLHPPLDSTSWQRLTVAAATGSSAHLRLFTLTSELPVTPPALPASGEPGVEATPLDEWRAAPADAVDLLVLNEPGAYLWIGGRLQAGDAGSPVIEGFRVEHDRDGWLPSLPALYARDPASGAFLRRLLALAEAALEDEAALLAGLPARMGAASAPDVDGSRSLDWLSGWVGFPLDTTWSEETRRAAVAGAFELNGRRGTRGGLHDLIELALGLDVTITEPAERVSLWQLGDESAALGLTTQLAGGEAQGAVLGTTAVLGSSSLIDDDELGAPLFDDLGGRFCVGVYAADIRRAGVLDDLERLVELERPAGTDSHICVIGPQARLGFQARVGIDAIVAGPPGQFALGGDRELGTDSALPPPAPGSPARLGYGARVGMNSRLI